MELRCSGNDNNLKFQGNLVSLFDKLSRGNQYILILASPTPANIDCMPRISNDLCMMEMLVLLRKALWIPGIIFS